jgi:hypothetical protein
MPIPRPTTAHPRRKTGRFGERPRVASPSASSRAPTARTGRPPFFPIVAPTRGEMAADTSSPTLTPPITHGSGHPVSFAMGSARTAGR